MTRLPCRRHALQIVILALATLFAVTAGAQAQTVFEQLVMPGELVQGHQKLQAECSNCHLPFSKQEQKKLCLDCHKEVASDVAAQSGFHGRRAEVGNQECSHCHTDHAGKDADIVGLDRETFDHDFTDFALDGAHRSVDCAACHKPPAKFREAKSACVDCHRDDEPHKSALGSECRACHNETRWADVKAFDHAKTRFALAGKHQDVACASCHIDEQYKGLPTQCVDCHRIQDVHAGRFGPKCEDCHQPVKWSEARFDHDLDTDFGLKGKHRDAKCESCHTSAPETQKLSTECGACHKADDPHKGQLGADCAQCHDEKGWREAVAFDHDLSSFPLNGLHALAACEQCHQTAAFRDAPTACNDCHAKDDAHRKALGPKCETCHTPNDWKLWVFDHGRQTAFALTGAHDGLDCAACHTPARAASPKISTACVACHADADVHRGRFGKQCEACHATTKFRDVRLRK